MAKDIIEKIKEQRKKENSYKKRQIEKNSKTPHYGLLSVEQLIIEYLTILTDKNIDNERYINEIPTDIIHDMIQDLGVLYEIKDKLKKEV